MKVMNCILEIEGLKFKLGKFDNEIEQNLLYNVMLERTKYSEPGHAFAWWVERVNNRNGKYPEKVEYMTTANGFATFLLHHGGHVFIGFMNGRNNILIECGTYRFGEGYDRKKLFCDFSPTNYQKDSVDLFGD